MQEFRSVVLSPKLRTTNGNGYTTASARPGTVKRVSDMLANSNLNDGDPFNHSPTQTSTRRTSDPFGPASSSEDFGSDEESEFKAPRPKYTAGRTTNPTTKTQKPTSVPATTPAPATTSTVTSSTPSSSSFFSFLYKDTTTPPSSTPSPPSTFSSFFHRRTTSTPSTSPATTPVSTPTVATPHHNYTLVDDSHHTNDPQKYKAHINNTGGYVPPLHNSTNNATLPRAGSNNSPTSKQLKHRSVEPSNTIKYTNSTDVGTQPAKDGTIRAVKKTGSLDNSPTVQPKHGTATASTTSMPQSASATAPRDQSGSARSSAGVDVGSSGNQVHKGASAEGDGTKMADDDGRKDSIGAECEETKSIKYKKLEALFNMPTVDLVELRKLCWSGIPNKWRALAWKLLLGYVPTSNDRRESTLARKRLEYEQGISQYFMMLSEEDGGNNKYELSNLEQIRKDIHRTNPNVPLFQNKIVQGCFERVLYMWAVKHPATGYVQGIDDLASPFFIVFLSDMANIECPETCDPSVIGAGLLTTIEADTYGCLCALLDGIQDHYTFAQPGIQRMMFKFKELIHRIDGELFQHLEDQDVNFVQLSFRWMNCFLLREFSNIRLIFRMWDTYFSEPDGFAVFHTYVCASLLLMYASNLKQLDAEQCMLFIQHLPTQNWTDKDMELLLSHAYMLRTLYHDAQAHLG
eukprot:TRINITY_DN3775_c0_g1_i1.p1 TRINITY_DN3775_c0_g1~~TRINITY_DN3775_c0_g1_i1.p1  ORF type:complete len:687 (+),score=119.41 TRINITY_DN3775_c0_g1_i1:147-2207(+)